MAMRRSEIDLDYLEEAREKASEDKSDLFDFYNGWWNGVTEELRKLKTQRQMLDDAAEARALKKVVKWLYGFEMGIDPSIIAELEQGECLKK